MNELKTYLLKFYPTLEAASQDIGVSRATIYNYVTRTPERMLSHIPALILAGKGDLVTGRLHKPEGFNTGRSDVDLITAVMRDYSTKYYNLEREG